MTRRDLAWRCIGAAALAIASTAGLSGWLGAEHGLGLPLFCLALIGAVLLIQGRRVPAALRIERSRHRALAQTIRARRRHESTSRTA